MRREHAPSASCLSSVTGLSVAVVAVVAVDSSKPFLTGVVRSPVVAKFWLCGRRVLTGDIAGDLSSEEGGEGF